MKEYHKITTAWKRDPGTKFRTLIEGCWAEPEFETLSNIEWVWTEKIDGTNIRIMWDGKKVTFGGKTDAAQIYAPLIIFLQEKCYGGAMEKIFDGTACIYGEGFGAKIQKGGGNYFSDHVELCVFDVRIGEVWLNRDSVIDIANKLELPVAPIIGIGDLHTGIELAKKGFESNWGNFLAEGLVMRPKVELLNRTGHRIITKIKHKDFK